VFFVVKNNAVQYRSNVLMVSFIMATLWDI